MIAVLLKPFGSGHSLELATGELEQPSTHLVDVERVPNHRREKEKAVWVPDIEGPVSVVTDDEIRSLIVDGLARCVHSVDIAQIA